MVVTSGNNEKANQLKNSQVSPLFSYQVNGSFSSSLTGEELEQRWGKGALAGAAAGNAHGQTLFKIPCRVYGADRKVLVIIWNGVMIGRKKKKKNTKFCLNFETVCLFVVLIHTACSKPRLLVYHIFMSSTLHFLGIYICQGSGYLIKKKSWFIIVGISIVRELPELLIKYVKVFVPQRNSKARSEKMDIAILPKSPQQILLFPLLL